MRSDVRDWFDRRTYTGKDFDIARVARAKRGRSASVVLPVQPASAAPVTRQRYASMLPSVVKPSDCATRPQLLGPVTRIMPVPPSPVSSLYGPSASGTRRCSVPNGGMKIFPSNVSSPLSEPPSDLSLDGGGGEGEADMDLSD